MRKKQRRFTGYCISLLMITVLTLILPACSPKVSLSSINITPVAPANLAVSSHQQFTAAGTYSNGSTTDITSKVMWKSSVPAVASISSSGLAEGLTAGDTNITAVLSGVTSQYVKLTVVATILTSIAVTPEAPNNLAVGSTQQFSAAGTYSDGSAADITSQVAWSSSDENVASVDSDGLALGLTAGTTDVTATFGNITSPDVLLTVTAQELSSIEVTPGTPNILAVGDSLQFAAIGTYSDDTTAFITSLVTWQSSDTSIAVIDSKGSATGIATGIVDITATMEGITSPPVILTVANTTTTSTGPQTNANTYSGTLTFTVNNNQTFSNSKSAESEMTVSLDFSNLQVALNNIGELENVKANYQFSATYTDTANNVNLQDSFAGTFSHCTVHIAWDTTSVSGIQLAFDFNGDSSYPGTLQGYGVVYPDKLINIDLNSYLLNNWLSPSGDSRTFNGPYKYGYDYTGTLTLVLTAGH